MALRSGEAGRLDYSILARVTRFGILPQIKADGPMGLRSALVWCESEVPNCAGRSC